MIWGGVWYDGTTEAVVVNGNLTVQSYVDTTLNPVIIPTMRQYTLVLQQHNA